MSSVTAHIVIAIGCALLVALLPHALIHRYWARYCTEEVAMTAGQVAFRIGLLHSIILGLVFSAVQTRFTELQNNMRLEVAATADLMHTVQSLDTREVSIGLAGMLSDYLRSVVEDDWKAMQRGRASPVTTAKLQDLYRAAARHRSTTAEAELLRERIPRLVEEMSRARALRLSTSLTPPVLESFWVIALLGYVLTAACFWVIKPTPPNLTLISMYAIMTAVVLVVIYDLAQPYAEPLHVSAEPFRVLMEGMERIAR